jgi:hypothetical protein
MASFCEFCHKTQHIHVYVCGWIDRYIHVHILVFELRAYCLLGRCSIALPYLQPFCPGQPRLDSYFMLLAITRVTGTCHHTQLFSVEMGGGLTNFLPGLDLSLNPPYLSLPGSLRWQAHAIVPSYYLRWGSLANFLTGLALTWDFPVSVASQVASLQAWVTGTQLQNLFYC